MPEDYDFIIIGSGAGGAAAAYKLVSSGRRVLLIEKGRTLPKDDSTLDVDKVMRRALFNSDEEWFDKDNRLFRPGEFPNIGGKTKWYGAALLRFSFDEFDYDASRLPASVAEHRSLIRAFRFSLAGLWNAGFVKTMDLSATAHACGTLVAGKDPRESVVDGNGKVHFMENLYVVDGSVLPRISRVNPSLTIYAWALRVAERLKNGVIK